MKLPILILAISSLILASNDDWESTITYNNGQWTTTTTYDVWTPTTTSYYSPWTPTTTPQSYWYGYTSYTYLTSTYCYTEGTVIVTITSLIPCPVYVTETSVIYECESCTTTEPSTCDNCGGSATTDSTLTSTQAQTQVQVIYANSAGGNMISSGREILFSAILEAILLIGVLDL